MVLPDLRCLHRELGTFPSPFPTLLLPTIGLDIYRLPGPACPHGDREKHQEGGMGDRPAKKHRSEPRSPARLPGVCTCKVVMCLSLNLFSQ